MRPLHILRASTITLGMTAALATAFAAGADRFANGQSYYGSPSVNANTERVVALGSDKYLNVDYGETVTFRNEGKQFSWTFDGLDGRSLSITKIAPDGFPTKPLTIYITRNPLNGN